MGRLIDENELIKGRVENDPVVIAAKCAPTAYDVDKVVAQLRKEKKKEFELCLAINDKAQRMKYIYEEQAFNRAIEIVKGGGVDAKTDF